MNPVNRTTSGRPATPDNRPGEWVHLACIADCARHPFDVMLDGNRVGVLDNLPFSDESDGLSRVEFAVRTSTDDPRPGSITAAADIPLEQAVTYQIKNLKVAGLK